MAVIEAEINNRGDDSEQTKEEDFKSKPTEEEGIETGKKEEHGNDSKEEEEESLKKDDLLKQQRDLAQANDAKTEGNQLFVAGQFEDALSKYELALYFAPSDEIQLRSICHSNRAVCFLKQNKYEEAIKECTKALELNAKNVRALIRRGEAHEKLEHFDKAIADMKKILELDPSNDQARKSIRHLEPLAAEKREKMMQEMQGKLKEMGNSFLGIFGMSVDNFVKDPNTGSYTLSSRR
ncbi:Tetratricopeptide repeat protein [Thalictrum thalictroides]|uniref:Tetratricopeptide repeat protein n=1 Tax=Thalictrum thalictroides TaxID=46969 RepID=A0A7J6UYI4_THATH|nr:Tetratricopeptide repeat protein [Thalictrum thalictroides]